MDESWRLGNVIKIWWLHDSSTKVTTAGVCRWQKAGFQLLAMSRMKATHACYATPGDCSRKHFRGNSSSPVNINCVRAWCWRYLLRRLPSRFRETGSGMLHWARDRCAVLTALPLQTPTTHTVTSFGAMPIKCFLPFNVKLTLAQFLPRDAMVARYMLSS